MTRPGLGLLQPGEPTGRDLSTASTQDAGGLLGRDSAYLSPDILAIYTRADAVRVGLPQYHHALLHDSHYWVRPPGLVGRVQRARFSGRARWENAPRILGDRPWNTSESHFRTP